MKRVFFPIAVLVLAGLSVGGCEAIKSPEIFKDDFWASSPLKQNSEAELGLAELAKGNLNVAETHFQNALEKNDKDVHALLGLGIIYQNTGQETKARQMYEAILAIRPDAAEQFVIWNSTSTRPVSEIASVNLALMDSKKVVDGMGPGAAGAPNGGGVAGSPQVSAMMGRAPSGAVAQPAPDAAREEVPTVMSMLSAEDTNVISRFKALRSLRDEGLLTTEEYGVRRQANLGALLPLTSPPPAAGLDRPVPSAEQIAGRLRAINRAMEMRAMTVAQQSSERGMILDALMPAAPVAVANPGQPPRGLMEAADAVRRIEALQAEGLISSDEYARERAAIEKAMQPEPPIKPASASGSVAAKPATMEKVEGVTKLAPGAGGPQPAVHLASYRSRQAADRGWAQLRRAHQDLLGGLSENVSEINLGPGKGTYFRLKAGPLSDRGAAEDVCRKLKRRNQYCEPTFMNGAG